MNKKRAAIIGGTVCVVWYGYYRFMRALYTPAASSVPPPEPWVPHDDRAATDVDANIYAGRVSDLLDDIEAELDNIAGHPDPDARFHVGNRVYGCARRARMILVDELHLDPDYDDRDELCVRYQKVRDRMLVEIFHFDPVDLDPVGDVNTVNAILDGIEVAIDLRSGPIGSDEPGGAMNEMARWVRWCRDVEVAIDAVPASVDTVAVKTRARAVLRRVLLEVYGCDPALVDTSGPL